MSPTAALYWAFCVGTLYVVYILARHPRFWVGLAKTLYEDVRFARLVSRQLPKAGQVPKAYFEALRREGGRPGAAADATDEGEQEYHQQQDDDCFASLPQNAVAKADEDRFYVHNFLEEEVLHADEQKSVVWWPPLRPMKSRERRRKETRTRRRNLWVFLPGGMRPGNDFYMHRTLFSGVLGNDDFCVFHNPGIVQPVQGSMPPPALADTRYVRDFLTRLASKEHHYHWTENVCVIGFSAGSILAISLASYFSNHSSRGLALAQTEMGSEADTAQSCFRKKQPLSMVIAVHGPDNLRHIMEYHSRAWVRSSPIATQLAAETCVSQIRCDVR